LKTVFGKARVAAAPRVGRPRQEEAGIKRNQILAAAQELFEQLGYRAVSTRLVAERAEVSTRTLYNHYADKGSLFAACLEFESAAFPRLEVRAGVDLRRALQQYAADIVRTLSSHGSLRLGMLVYREGGDFPELLRAAEANYERCLVQPLAKFLRDVGVAGESAEQRARLFINMALSEWQLRVVFERSPLRKAEINRHARFAAAVFLDGVSCE
jgi:TetR/AcrR family transcriptional regulator, mexJK operon transcriptional repressor